MWLLHGGFLPTHVVFSKTTMIVLPLKPCTIFQSCVCKRALVRHNCGRCTVVSARRDLCMTEHQECFLFFQYEVYGRFNFNIDLFIIAKVEAHGKMSTNTSPKLSFPPRRRLSATLNVISVAQKITEN